jgi:hypothetical protein
VAAAVIYQPVVDLTALGLLTPADGDFFELQDSTGADTDPDITGVPGGLVGAPGLTFRLRYDDPPQEFVFLGYFANDSETRYLKFSGGTLTGQLLGDNSTSAATPGFAFDGDSNTGVLRPGADELALVTGGTSRLTIDSSGTVAVPGTLGVTGDLTLNAQSDLRFADADSSNWVAFQAPSTVSANVTWTLPATDASVSGYALKSNGAGQLSWGLAGGALGTGTDQIFYENDQTVTGNYSITAGKNAMTAGPVTVNSGVTVTVPSGSSWSII